MNSTVQTPVVNFTDYLLARETHADHELPETVLAQCHAAWEAREIGVIAGRDPRTNPAVVDCQQKLLARYFDRPAWMKWADEPDDGNHQVGVTPPYTEFALPYTEWRKGLTPDNLPQPVVYHDPKWRWMHPVGPRPPLAEQAPYAHLNRDPVVPQGFEPDEWLDTLNAAGEMLLDSTFVLLEMLALGAGLPRDSFTEICTLGTHLLAPTGSNLSEYVQPGTVLAGAHDDLGFITGHLRANVPGCLRAWTRQGKRFTVRVPRGYNLWQFAQQFESVTGGEVHAGMHEVVVPTDPEDLAVLARLRAEAHAQRRDLWRDTTTVFCHARSKAPVGPQWHFRTPQTCGKYPDMDGGAHLDRGIRLIGLCIPK